MTTPTFPMLWSGLCAARGENCTIVHWFALKRRTNVRRFDVYHYTKNYRNEEENHDEDNGDYY